MESIPTFLGEARWRILLSWIAGDETRKGSDMAAYLIADITITDPEAYQEYSRQVGATVATVERFGGRPIVNGATSQPEAVEGDWKPTRILVLEFPNMEQARAWYDSPEYVAIRGIRQRASESRMIFVYGV
jgi:uncharacterized protein (DUF1330 family)